METIYCLSCGAAHQTMPEGNKCRSCGKELVLDLDTAQAAVIAAALKEEPQFKWKAMGRDLGIVGAVLAVLIGGFALFFVLDQTEGFAGDLTIEMTPDDAVNEELLQTELMSQSKNLTTCASDRIQGDYLVEVDSRFVLDAQGNLQDLKVTTSRQGSGLADCVRDVMSRWHLSNQSGGTVPAHLPYRLYADVDTKVRGVAFPTSVVEMPQK